MHNRHKYKNWLVDRTHLWEVHFRFEGGGKQPHGLMLQVVEGADAPHCQGL